MEGKIVLISSDSPDSQKLRNDLVRDFHQDHQLGERVVPLDVKWVPYVDQEENFVIVDPNGKLTMDQIIHMIRNSDNYFVSKLQNPKLAFPLEHLIDPLVEKVGESYYNLRETNDDKGFQDKLTSRIASLLPEKFRGVIDKSKIDNELIPLSQNIMDIFRIYEKDIMDVFRDVSYESPVNPNDGRLKHLKTYLKGFLGDILTPRNKQIFLDELNSISHRIGTKILRDGDKGRLSWITPWLDGRSDHNKTNPHEAVRWEEFAEKVIADNNVSNVYMINAHSQRQVDMVTQHKVRGEYIHVENLTYTNEFISRLLQNPSIDFLNSYIVSPDEGGLCDAMVFARELWRRTQGNFSGRVVLFKKTRVKHHKIAKMEFLGSYIYNQKEPESNFKVDKDNNPLPYDILFPDFKVPKIDGTQKKLKKNPNYIGNWFNQEYDPTQLKDLQKIIKGHLNLARDDIIETGTTLILSGEKAYSWFESQMIAMAEHPSFANGQALSKFQKIYGDGILQKCYTSTSIVHNTKKYDWLFPISISRRFFRRAKPNHMSWLQNNFPEQHERITKYIH